MTGHGDIPMSVPAMKAGAADFLTKPTPILHGEDDQIVPIAASALLSAKLMKGAKLKGVASGPHGMCSTNKNAINNDFSRPSAAPREASRGAAPSRTDHGVRIALQDVPADRVGHDPGAARFGHAAADGLRRRAAEQVSPPTVHYRTAQVDGVGIFYREAGPTDAPVVLLLHGFPTSSHMFRNLIPALADRHRVIAPAYPGLGDSDAPDHKAFAYTFAHYADVMDGHLGQLGATRYAMYAWIAALPSATAWR